jgi:hypothetical protein
LGSITAPPVNSGNVGLGSDGKPTLDWLRTVVGDIAREVLRRAQAIEVPVAARTAEALLTHRELSTSGVMAAPEPKIAPETAATAAAGPPLPAADPTKAQDPIYRIGNAVITRGDLYSMIDAVRPYMPESTPEQLAQTVIRRALIQGAVVRNAFPTQIEASLKKAQEIRDDVDGGKLTFEEAAKKFSDEALAKTQGGLIDGGVASFVTDYEHLAMSKLKPSGISQPFLASYNVEFLRLEKIEPGATPFQTKFYYRRVMVAVDLGVPPEKRFAKVAELTTSARIDVMEPEFEPFLPPSMQRVVVRKPK